MLVQRVRPPMRRRSAPAVSAALDKEAALLVLALLAGVEARHRAVVAHDAGPDLARLALLVGQRDGLQLRGSQGFGRGLGEGIHGVLLFVLDQAACASLARLRA